MAKKSTVKMTKNFSAKKLKKNLNKIKLFAFKLSI